MKKLKSYTLTEKQKEAIEDAMNGYEERFKFYMEQIKARDQLISELQSEIRQLIGESESSDEEWKPTKR